MICKGVQESTKTMISYCIDNLLKVLKVGYTKKVQKNMLNKVCLPILIECTVGAEKSQCKLSKKLAGAE